ncbi:unnamed protein product [Thlaspi arvense]|uniref:MADS-box domain-containing protein n=1 Tax=Thlaspi arvense TaxID=13288 RepID=A0AAU9S0R9_THLAR|nr:unnamed protein product [Thlaspi arvense]
MPRKKLKLAYISDDRVRKATYKQRKRGLIKKLDELKILCGVDGCAVIYNPLNSNPEVWPSNSEVYNAMQKFEMLPEMDKTYLSVNHEEFLIQNIAKVEKQNQNLTEANKEKLMRELMFDCLHGNMGGLTMNDITRRNLCEFIDQYLKSLQYHKNVTLNDNLHFETGESSSMAIAADMAPTTMAEAESFSFTSAPFFNSPQLSNEFQSITSSNQSPCLGSNSMSAPIFNSPQQTNDLPSMMSSNQGSSQVDYLASNLLSVSDQDVYYPVMNQDEVYYPNQNQNQQDGFVEQMMKHSESFHN